MVLDNYKEFLDELIKNTTEKGVDVSNYYLDHFAYQTASNESYDKLKIEFEKIADLVSENVVNGRRVGIFKFKTPFAYNNKKILVVELLAPKEDKVGPEGLEHAEFAIGMDFNTFLRKYPKVDWDTSNINRPDFPMIKLKLS